MNEVHLALQRKRGLRANCSISIFGGSAEGDIAGCAMQRWNYVQVLTMLRPKLASEDGPPRIRGSLMRATALAIATAAFVFATDVKAQGTRDYTGPLPPTNVSPLSPGTTPPTPNWRANVYPPGYEYRVVPQQRRIYPNQRMRVQ